MHLGFLCHSLLSHACLLGRTWCLPFLKKNRIIFFLHHTAYRLFFFFLPANKPFSAFLLCNASVLRIQSWSPGIASWNWILQGAADKILEGDMSVAEDKVKNLELWSWDAPGSFSEGPCLPCHTAFLHALWRNLFSKLVLGETWLALCFSCEQHCSPFLWLPVISPPDVKYG